jgi:dCTP diphosphatase
MMGEVGEMAELFQWRGDGNPTEQNDKGLLGCGWKEEDIDHAGQELADVAIYCLRLADVIGIHDLGNAAILHVQKTNIEKAE